MESTKNFYHVTRQNLHFVHAQLRSRLMIEIKQFDSEMIFFGLDLEKNNSYGQKHFRETNYGLCKVSIA